MAKSKTTLMQEEINHLKSTLSFALNSLESRKQEIKDLQSYKNKMKMTGKQRSASVYYNLTAGELEGRRKEVFNTIKANPSLDRHQLKDAFKDLHGEEISSGSISGRLAELVQSDLISVSGLRTGRFGKEIATYIINKGA